MQGNSKNIVQRLSKRTTMSCDLPESHWDSCKFQHFDGSQGLCSLVFGQNEAHCENFEDSFIHITKDGKCQLVLESVGNDHVGAWACKIVLPEASEKKFDVNFDLSVIQEPSDIAFKPATENFNYKLDDWFDSSLDVQNVAPKPNVAWSINNNSIEGLTIRYTDVLPQSNTIEFKDKIQFQMKESFHNKYFEYTLKLEVVDEFGRRNPEDDYVKQEKIKFLCSDCDSPTTTPASTTTSPTLVTTTTTSSIPEPCSFNLTNLSDDLYWPVEENCVSEPRPTWFMTIFCDGYCFNAINVVLDTITRDNYDNDPCDTYLYLESLEQEHPYNETM